MTGPRSRSASAAAPCDPGRPAATALIAEDEPLLADALRAELARAWPELEVVAIVGDGAAAVARALALAPDVLFFDIRMPGLGGIDAAAELADRWHDGGPDTVKPFPALVFVTAYDQYAIAAFEAGAVDYLLKPVQPARLQKTVLKVRSALVQRAQPAIFLEASMARLRALLAPPPEPPPEPPLALLPVAVGARVRMLPIGDVLCFDAADKYLRVLTAEQEYLLRTPLRELLPRLDRDAFWQVHRGTVVRASAIDSVLRDGHGRLTLTLRGRPDRFPVSRVYASLFKAL